MTRRRAPVHRTSQTLHSRLPLESDQHPLQTSTETESEAEHSSIPAASISQSAVTTLRMIRPASIGPFPSSSPTEQLGLRIRFSETNGPDSLTTQTGRLSRPTSWTTSP